ncbi:hypothetical protein WA026_003142 [Henosepilachna vigintioctopunctata]|uniref:C2H2-type domain-containing protein n=1 Tax=Henosepilachna vigintioctopunctata TaxID=420089 RepID=A0AAW1TLF2_9CUCU
MFHMGKYPFKCEFCYAEYVTRVDYEMCLKSHKASNESNEDSLTLKDFANTSITLQQSTANQSASDGESNCPPVPGEEGMIFSCELCKRQFNSSTGLLRHKVRKHHQKNKKKYFIKGMKNAKCDICNREFSTQSYMQLHRKLHMREDVGYKYKVFGKSKYSDADDKEKTKTQKDDVELGTESNKNDEGNAETIDVTPDITLEREMDEDSEPELDSPKAKMKCYSRVKESTPDVELTKISSTSVKVKEDSTEDSDDNPLQMDLDECSNVPSETKQEIHNENELKVEKSTS